jgi:photosystem II stability/assembly factor-like uncharacterized protein
MKRFLLLICSFFVLFSCNHTYQARDIETISIEEISMDSMSIRAIHAENANSVYYASSTGVIGNWYKTDNDWEGTLPEKITYKDSIALNYRSISSNGNNIYALSIGNPAVLTEYNNQEPDPRVQTDVLGYHRTVYVEEHEKVFYDSMKFFDEQNGIAMGDPTEDCLSIILTKDGGTTWNKIPCEKLPKVVEGEAAFAASNTNIKVLGKTAWIVTGGTKARVFKTTDLGETWEVFDTPIIQGDGPQGIYSVDFADENNGIIIGGDYSKPEENKANKAITKDGGKTWMLVADGQNPNYKSCVQYVPGTDGKEVFAVGKTGISYSKDGGLTWTEVSKDGYYVIQFVDKNNAWLAGNQKIGRLYLK